MRIDPQHGEARMPFDLRCQGGDEGAVVAAQDGEERLRRNLRQPLRHLRPACFDVGSRIEVSEVGHLEPGQQPAVLGYGRDRCGQAANPLWRHGRPFAVNGRPVIRDAGHDDAGRFRRAAQQPTPWPEAVEVHRAPTGVRIGRSSGTFKIKSAPISKKAQKTEKMIGKPPGRPRIRGPALKGSSRNPPTNRAMIPDPAVAMLLNPMNSPASSAGITSWMKAQSTEKNKP